MANFVCMRRKLSTGMGYYVVHSPLERSPANLENAVFAAFINGSDEKAEVPSEFRGMKTEQRKIGNLELSIVHSEFSHYKTLVESRSPKSKALYAGHTLLKGEEFGMLLQYLPMGATTTAHLHTYREGYFIIYGFAISYLLNGDARHGETALEFKLGVGGRNLRTALIVPGNTWHPLKGVNDSLIVIVAHRSIVEDQVYGTRNNHHRSMSFDKFSEMFTVSGTQKTRGPSAAAKEAGSQ